MHCFGLFTELSFSDKTTYILSILTLPAVAILLHALGYKKTRSLLEWFMPVSTSCHIPQGGEMRVIHSLARIIHIAARHNIYEANCLKQSLLLWFILGKRFIFSEIKFGIEKNSDSQFNAHAWVECGGEPLIDSNDAVRKFSVFKVCSTSRDNERNL